MAALCILTRLLASAQLQLLPPGNKNTSKTALLLPIVSAFTGPQLPLLVSFLPPTASSTSWVPASPQFSNECWTQRPQQLSPKLAFLTQQLLLPNRRSSSALGLCCCVINKITQFLLFICPNRCAFLLHPAANCVHHPLLAHVPLLPSLVLYTSPSQ